jgi:putative membrane protein
MAGMSTSEHEMLRQAIAEAEGRTGTHIAVVMVPASDRYLMYPLAYGAFFALVLGGAMALLWPGTMIGPAVLGETLAFVAFSLVFDWLPLRLLLVPQSVQRARARNLAHREFAARILTTHRGGMLLFVSQGERYVELLADRELHVRVGQEAWDRIVGALTADAKTKPLPECLRAAIAACGAAIEPGKSDVD